MLALSHHFNSFLLGHFGKGIYSGEGVDELISFPRVKSLGEDLGWARDVSLNELWEALILEFVNEPSGLETLANHLLSPLVDALQKREHSLSPLLV